LGQVQQAVSETVGDLLREGLSVIGFVALMFWYDWNWRSWRSSARRWSCIRWFASASACGRSTARSQEAARAPVAPDRGRSRSRIVKALAAEARGRALRAAPTRLIRQPQITSTVSLLPADHGVLGGVAIVALLWYGRGRIGPPR
jgi:hypothetical protein